MNIFGTKQPPPPDAKSLAKEWKRKLQKESRDIDKQIANIKREETRALTECKRLAKSNHLPAARILAKQIAETRKATERMYLAKAQLNSVAMQLQSSASMATLKESISSSTSIMTLLNGLTNLPEISKTVSEMAREMEKAGLIEELIDDTFQALEPEGLEAETDAEVDRILHEITTDILSKASEAPIAKISQPQPTISVVVDSTGDVNEPVVEDEDIKAMQERLQSL